ncbi:MAG: META domain-containing protein [Acidimicrobiales bacterium]|nr:META domain-containing protein [Acidimicrobiales bacterium]
MKRILILVGTFAILTSACGSDAVSVGSGSSDFVGEWQLQGGTLDGKTFPLVDGWRVTFQLEEDGRFGGRAACNGYGGTYELDGSAISFGEWSITEMGCEPAVMASEQAFITVLQRTPELERAGDELRMRGDGTDLSFSLIPPLPVAELIGTTWLLDTIFQGAAASSTLGEAELRFDADGTFTGSTGCRTLTGTYQLNGDEIAITQMAADGECPPELQRQDNTMISVIESPRVEIYENRLSLWTAGDEGLGFRAVS